MAGEGAAELDSGHRSASDAHKIMRTLHTIRLRGPWGCQPLARFEWSDAGDRRESDADLPPAGRLKMPSDWSPICGADFKGRVRFRRRFHWPTPLTPRERVWLVFDGVSGSAVVHLNGELLGELSGVSRPAEFDVTKYLAPTNILTADLTWSADGVDDARGGARVPAGGLTGEVRLEVRLS